MKIWKDTDNDAQYTDAAVVDMSLLQPFKLTMCEKFGSVFPKLELSIESIGPPSDYIKSGPLFIASQKLKEILEKFSVGMEAFPVIMHQNGVSIDTQYFYIHLLEEIDCIDRSSSNFTVDGDYIDEIEDLVLNENQTRGANLFKIANCIDSILVVSSELEDEVRDKGITGVKFVEPKDWN